MGEKAAVNPGSFFSNLDQREVDLFCRSVYEHYGKYFIILSKNSDQYKEEP